MTEQNENPAVDDDTEGHGQGNPAVEDDVAGLDSMDDTEGHNRGLGGGLNVGDEDDTEGHLRKSR